MWTCIACQVLGGGGGGRKKHTAFLCLCHENEPCSLYFSQNYSTKGMEVKISLCSIHGGKP